MFGGVTVGSEMVQPDPPDCVPSREGRIQLLEAFNFHWQVQDLRTVSHDYCDAHHKQTPGITNCFMSDTSRQMTFR